MEPKRLTLSTTNRKLGGVCGGVAQYLGIDPTLVRVLWVLSVLLAGFGVLAYIIMWIVVPEEGSEAALGTERSGAQRSVAEGIAEERYARGEITAEELREIKRELRS